MPVLNKLGKSKSLKVFLIAMILVFSFNVNRPKAFAPLAWAGGILAGLAAEQLVTMGVKSVSKAVLEKQAKNFGEQAALKGDFDFLGTNPYRNKDGSITLSPTANDRAKMAGLISGALVGTFFAGEDGAVTPSVASGQACLPDQYNHVGIKMQYLDPATYPQANIDNRKIAYDDVRKYTVALYYESLTAGQYVYEIHSRATGRILASKTAPIDDGYLQTEAWSQSAQTYAYSFLSKSGVTFNGYGTFSKTSITNAYHYQGESLANTVGAELVTCNQLIVPSTLKNVYPAPMNMSSTYQMPNEAQLSDKPLIINNILPPSETEGPITWNEIEDYYKTSGEDFQQVMDSNIGQYVAKGSIINNQYTINEINNYYTDVDNPVKVGDFEPSLETPVVTDPNLPTVPGEDVSELDHSMWQVMKNTYNYLDDGIDSALTSMKGITDSAQGITTYLGSAMGWLPAEWRAVFTSAFVLGVFAHFLRR